MKPAEILQGNVIQGPWGDKVTADHIAEAEGLKPVVEKILAPLKMPDRAWLIWDSLAPEMVMLDRLKGRFAFLFAEWCWQSAKIIELRGWLIENGDTYASETRNGNQLKCHPYVGQMHEHWRQMMRLTEKFALTPSDEKQLVRVVHGDIFSDFDQF